jgi:hypothetical protein
VNVSHLLLSGDPAHEQARDIQAPCSTYFLDATQTRFAAAQARVGNHDVDHSIACAGSRDGFADCRYDDDRIAAFCELRADAGADGFFVVEQKDGAIPAQEARKVPAPPANSSGSSTWVRATQTRITLCVWRQLPARWPGAEIASPFLVARARQILPNISPRLSRRGAPAKPGALVRTGLPGQERALAMYLSRVARAERMGNAPQLRVAARAPQHRLSLVHGYREKRRLVAAASARRQAPGPSRSLLRWIRGTVRNDL